MNQESYDEIQHPTQHLFIFTLYIFVFHAFANFFPGN